MNLSDKEVKALAIVCLAIIEVFALLNGIDSVMLGGVVAIIAGLAGYEIGLHKQNGK